VVARQRTIDPFRWPVVGESRESGPPMSPPLEPPAWWADALITD
jgi:ribonuclease Z